MTTTTDFSTVSVNGIELAYREQGQGEPLLLLHGFFGSSADWVHLFDLDELARSYRLILPDARGHGRSTNPTARSRIGCARPTSARCWISWDSRASRRSG